MYKDNFFFFSHQQLKWITSLSQRKSLLSKHYKASSLFRMASSCKASRSCLIDVEAAFKSISCLQFHLKYDYLKYKLPHLNTRDVQLNGHLSSDDVTKANRWVKYKEVFAGHSLKRKLLTNFVAKSDKAQYLVNSVKSVLFENDMRKDYMRSGSDNHVEKCDLKLICNKERNHKSNTMHIYHSQEKYRAGFGKIGPMLIRLFDELLLEPENMREEEASCKTTIKQYKKNNLPQEIPKKSSSNQGR